MDRSKHIYLDELPGIINSLVKDGYMITRCVLNGKTGDRQRIFIEYKDRE